MEDPELSDLTLAWMMSQFDSLLDFDDDYVAKEFRRTTLKEGRLPGVGKRSWGCGKL